MLPRPGGITCFEDVAGGDKDPVAELFGGHVGEAAGEVGLFVGGAAEGGELVMGALVVGEGEAAGGGGVLSAGCCVVRGEFDSIGIGVVLEEIVEQVFDEPMVLVEFPEDVV